MQERKLSFGRHFSLAYEDTFRVLRAMWPALVAMSFIMVAVTLVAGLAGRFVGTRLGDAGLDLLSSVALAYGIAPYLLAFCRAVALDETTSNPEKLRTEPVAQKFAAWLVVLFLIAGLYDFVFKLFGPRFSTDMAPEQVMATTVDPGLALVVLALLIGSLAFSVRATTFLPMLALDPANASLRPALAQTRGRFWFIAALLTLIGLPVGFAGLVLIVLVSVMLGPLALFVLVPLTYSIFALAMLVGIAASTRLYQRYGG